MRRGVWNLLISGCLALEWNSPALAQENPPAPAQHRQTLSISAHPSLFTTSELDIIFKEYGPPPGDVLVERHQKSGIDSADATDADLEAAPLQQVQYPTDDSAARDEDPVGHYQEPRWNPFPFLTEQLACMPVEKRGLVIKERAVTMTVLPAGNSDFNISTLDVRGTAYLGQFPILQVTPRFGWHLLGGPGTTDVPPQLYDTGVDTTIFLPLSKQWSFLGGVGPSLFTDGQNLSSQAFRMTGRALGFYQWSETTKVAVGFIYLGREDLIALPAAGVFYKPNERVKAELFFPKPKVGYRIFANDGRERWCYLAGEFGGNSWAVERSDGSADVLTYRDYRLIAGFEQVDKEVRRWLVETGFVFGRRIEYESGIGDTNPGVTGMIRAGLVF
ncbi:DUF6268 family outer membrane beta-barrel protein [Planctomicrobium piriforme]|uniref:DUF6268 domain-containing protein n=1 Tax=Planctomicrobium piriforme TaxID=1576369 RepID=A0A1I3IFU0_9PLAN|nr:DUF6268 family outer membrane beta-barrel protein [Planctomicrobium piriforme]SFI46796.1 hypothetical protein SAMN05421753_109105 [Planctomicrobium piriforme]